MRRVIAFAVFVICCANIPDIGANKVCSLPAESGMCKAYFPMFFFNSETQKCESFVYGGCGGNDNRFQTVQECQATCQSPTDICQLPKIVGPCEAIIRSWFFDVNSCRCRRFVYGGCMGNENRFGTRDECQRSCGNHPCVGCRDPLKVGPCRAAMPRWFYNDTSNTCEEFSWGGCQPNGNNFMDEAACNSVCRYSCTLPLDRGTEETTIRRFYYNPRTNRCRRFMWGGMGNEVNTNNFRTRRRCRNVCIKRP